MIANIQLILPEYLTKIASHPEIPAEVSEKIASHPKTPITVLEKLADNNSDKGNIYKRLLQNPNTPASLLENHIYPSCVDFLMEGTEPDFGRFIVFLSPYAKVSHLENNFRSESWLERWAIAQNPNTPDNTLSYLVQDGNRLVRSAAELNIKQKNDLKTTVKNESVPISFFNSAVNNDDDVLIALLGNPQLSQENLVQLTKHKNPQIVEEAKLHINWNEEIENPEEFIRQALRKNNLTIPKGKDDIVSSFSVEMISFQSVYDFLSSIDKKVRSRVALASNPNTPVTALEKLATDSNSDVRRNVASNPNTPITVLEKLATDIFEWVRSDVGGNIGFVS